MRKPRLVQESRWIVTSVQLRPETYRALKIRALDERCPARDVIARALDVYLQTPIRKSA